MRQSMMKDRIPGDIPAVEPASGEVASETVREVMPSEGALAASGGTAEPSASKAGPPYKLLLGAIISLAVLPDVANSTVFASIEEFSASDTLGQNLMILIRSIQVLMPTLLIMRLLPWAWSFYGLKYFQAKADVAGGVGVWIVATMAVWGFYVTVAATLPSLYAAEYYNGSSEEQSVPSETEGPNLTERVENDCGLDAGGAYAVLVLVWIVTVVANSFAEEFAIRGLLLPVLEQRLGSALWAAVLSSVLFASYHVYQGYIAMTGTFIIGIVYSGYFLTYRRIWPLIVAHTLTNLMTWTI